MQRLPSSRTYNERLSTSFALISALGRVGARRTAQLCFPTPPSEPDVRLSAHPALQGLATSAPSVTTGLVISFAFTAAPLPLPGSWLTRTSSGTKQLLDLENVNPLASFPLCAT